MASGSTAHTPVRTSAPKTHDAQLAAASAPTDPQSTPADQTAGLVPAAPEPPRKLRAMAPPADGIAPFAGTVPLQEIALPGGGGALGIPEIVLAAYRNAELAMQSSAPNCGVSWHLLAGIGRIESGHARSGHTDAAGTTIGAIYGPSLDGTLPGNEVIKAAEGGYVRAVGPMQFLPGTWAHYSSDGNGDGVADPNNVFDAALGAAKYLCSGGLDLRDPSQELRSVLRYNNSLSYAANVLSWSNAYATGGAPTRVDISPELIPPGSMQAPNGSEMVAVNSTYPAPSAAPPPETSTASMQPPAQVQTQPQGRAQAPTQVMINIPGLPPIPCGIFCPPPPPPKPCDPAVVPAPMPKLPGDPAAEAQQRWAPGDPVRPADAQNADPNAPRDPNAPANCVQPQAQEAPGQPPAAPAPEAAAPAPEAAAPEQQQTENAAPTAQPGPAEPAEPAQSAAPAPAPAPAITLPFGITIPMPVPAG
ncbi:membrane-bound lytic murein transglycosylase B [Nocardia transvalensis]|uniref:Membrane-bound lytic murein transglycosylase B n=1 Tax=Nocardia transvalensis TaxID=37333 RepID=A0A7W9UGM6_9NOCA|nr:lytic murein transglycosylase [Nocardia transvalensis]MBB5912454.1 membrane-bound lytic murein transglycosylase B [Nocardia transvalensis]